MPGALDFDAAAVLAALRTKRAAQGAPLPKAPNPPNRREGAATGLGGLVGLGEEHPSDCTYDAPAGPVLVARRIAASIAAGAEREDDPDGWLLLVLPDGRRHVVAPHIVAALDAAGLLPELPPTVPRSTYASTARPPSWSDPRDEPREGDRCCVCKSERWWTSAPRPDGWTCSTCHPPSL